MLNEVSYGQDTSPLTLGGFNDDLRARANYYSDYQPSADVAASASQSSGTAESRYRQRLSEHGYSENRGSKGGSLYTGSAYGTGESANRINGASQSRVEDTYDESVVGLYPHMYRGTNFNSNVFGGVAAYGRYGNLNRRTLYGQIFANQLRPRDTTMRVGAVDIKVGALGGFDYTDNVFLTQDNKRSDIMAKFAVTAGGEYQMSEINNINFYVSAGVGRYLLHKESNERLTNNGVILNVSPDTYLGFDFNLGDLFLTISNRLFIRQNIDNSFILDRRDNYDTIINNLGISALWQVNSQVDVTAGYSFIKQWPLDSEFDFVENTTHQVLSAITYSPTGSWATGVEAGYYHVDYEENVNNSSDNITLGPFFSAPVSEYTQFRVAGGWQWGNFSNTGSNGDTSQLSSWFANILVENQLNAYLQQSFAVGRGSNVGVASNYTNQTWGRYGLTTRLNQTFLSAGVTLIKQSDSGGSFSRDVDRFGIDASVTHPLGEMLTLYAGYYYGNNDSNFLTSQFVQHRFNIDLAYPLTPDIDLILGYRLNKANAEVDELSFTENRAGINLSYNF
ncbi:MAG: hypothetical protein AAF591_11840 [Verrucomicrobiota bacterium]